MKKLLITIALIAGITLAAWPAGELSEFWLLAGSTIRKVIRGDLAIMTPGTDTITSMIYSTGTIHGLRIEGDIYGTTYGDIYGVVYTTVTFSVEAQKHIDASYLISGSTIAAVVQPLRITSYYEYNVLISTIMVRLTGVGSCSASGNIEQRTLNQDTSGTPIWASTVTFSNSFTGGTMSVSTMSANSALWFVPSTMSGNISTIEFTGIRVKQ